MFLLLLGILDFLVAIGIICLQYDYIGFGMALAIIVYLLIKAFIFNYELAAALYVIIGVYVGLMLIGLHTVFAFLAAFYLLHRGYVIIAKR